MLEHKELTCGHFTINAITGLRDHNRGYWLGVVDLLADPQQWTNKWLSQVLYILNTNAKGGLIAEQGAFTNPRKFEQDWADPSKIVWANPGGLDKIKDRTPPQYPEGLRLLIYPGKLGGNVDIINGLNHYIGMKTLHTEDFLEFKILPWIIGVFSGLFLLVSLSILPLSLISSKVLPESAV